MACGLDHTLVVAQDGRLYSFGDNSLGQLGRSGTMGVQTGSADPQDWIVKDEDGEVVRFAKVRCFTGPSRAD